MVSIHGLTMPEPRQSAAATCVTGPAGVCSTCSSVPSGRSFHSSASLTPEQKNPSRGCQSYTTSSYSSHAASSSAYVGSSLYHLFPHGFRATNTGTRSGCSNRTAARTRSSVFMRRTPKARV